MFEVEGPLFEVPLSDEQLALLGLLSAVWSQFEFVVETGLLLALKLPLLTDQLPRDITLKLVKLKTFAETKVPDKKARKEIIDFCDRGTVVAVKRNLAVHGKWARNIDDKGKPWAVSWFKVKAGEPLNTLPATDMLETTNEICRITKGLRTTLIALGYFPS